ncbi:MAG: YncE family protein [Bacteroidota bacterium]
MSNNFYVKYLLLISLVLPFGLAQAQTAGNIHQIKKTVIGGEGSWDYLTVDAEQRKLYVSHFTQVEVLNVDTHEKLGTIAGQGIHGVTLVPERGLGYVTNGKANTVTIFDTKTLAVKGEIAVGEKPDASLYDVFSKRLFIFNSKSSNVSVIDPATGTVVGTIALEGAPEAGVSNGKGTIFVNLEDKSEIVAFDATSLKVLRRFPLAPGDAPTGLAIDLQHQLLFSVCHNKWMMVVDAGSGAIVSKVPIGERVDGVVFDAERQIAVSSNGEGSMTVVKVVSPTEFKVVATVKTEPGAKTIALDTKTHHLFTSTAQLGEKPAATAENPNPKPKAVPGTFMVLEYGE